MNNMKRFCSLMICLVVFISTKAQNAEPEKNDYYQFSTTKNLPATPVKDQYKSGTCWSFATTSFIESELLRLGYDTTDISEMFFVYHTYIEKAGQYVRLHGSANFGPGGQAHDVLNVIKSQGFLTEEEFPGLIRGRKSINTASWMPF